MRSKKNRIVVTGSLLSVLAVVFAVRQESAAPPRALNLTSAQVSAAAQESSPAPVQVEAKENSAPLVSQVATSLWKYTHKPANAARVESIMMTPSHDIHYAQIDNALLSSDRSPLKQEGARFDIALPNGQVVPVIIDRTENLGPDRYISEGSANGPDRGRAVFAYNEGEMAAVIDDGEHGSWQIRSIGGSTAQVFKVDGTMVPTCSGDHHSVGANVATADDIQDHEEYTAEVDLPIEEDTSSVSGSLAGSTSTVQAPTLAAITTTAAAAKTEIRILIPYSKVIETVMAKAAIRSTIDLAVAQLNNDLTRSAIPVTVVLAGAPALQYDQEWSGTGSPVLTALSRVTSPVDGMMEDVHIWRVNVKADLVCFAMCRHDSSYSGAGYILGTPGDPFNAVNGFSVVDFWYLSSNSTFSHEIGHNLGCTHDREHARTVDGSVPQGIYAYSYGYRFNGKDNKQYRTIMAYAPGNVLPYFSNPNLTAWSPISTPVGAALGRSNQAYNALTITQNAAEVASYRNSRLTDRIARRLRGY